MGLEAVGELHTSLLSTDRRLPPAAPAELATPHTPEAYGKGSVPADGCSSASAEFVSEAVQAMPAGAVLDVKCGYSPVGFVRRHRSASRSSMLQRKRQTLSADLEIKCEYSTPTCVRS